LDKKIRIGAVSYLNTRPLIYGMRNSEIADRIELQLDYPARTAAKLMNDEIDVGLIPVAVIPWLKEYHLVSDHCIGCDGAVGSVAIFGDESMENMRSVWLDYQSRTSVALTKILLRDHWQVTPELLSADNDGYMEHIHGHTGGLVIGDRAFIQKKRSAVMFDLGQAWKDLTGLPFVFATWVSNKPVDDEFIALFNEANAVGLAQLDKVIAENPFPHTDLDYYYRVNMSYAFDETKKAGMKKFLSMIGSV
jgi:chorismate dehydratase